MKITDKHIEPLPSSTVLLVRQGKAELEVLMMLRKKNTSFGSSYVFPGGVLEKTDTIEEEALSLKERNLFNEKLNLKTGGFALIEKIPRGVLSSFKVLPLLAFLFHLCISKFPKKRKIIIFSGKLNVSKGFGIFGNSQSVFF